VTLPLAAAGPGPLAVFLLRLVAMALVGGVGPACNPTASPSPPAPPGPPAVSSVREPPTPTPSTPAAAHAAPLPTGVPASASSCSTDADCRTWSSYCADAPCACMVLAKGQPDPQCSGGGSQVRCLVDPCQRKAATCQQHACALTPGGAVDR